MTGSSVSSRKILSKIATNRLQKELTEWQINPPSGFSHKVTDNLQRWVIEVNGAQGTIYANEKYQLQVDFPENYPMEAPQVIFLHPAPLHPHIYSNGHVHAEEEQTPYTSELLANKIICKDALKVDFPDFDYVVANIPYGISSPLVAKLVFGGYKFRCATLLLQKEFATRLLANAGDSEFNRLAVNVKLVADVEHVMNVSKRDFVPIPKVDSSVVNIRLKNEVPDVDLNEWWAFTKTCFGKKNKTLGATFRQKKKVAELLSLSKVTTRFDEDVVQDDVSDNEDEDEDEEDDEGKLLGMEVKLFKEKLVGIVRSAGLEDKRPSKLSNKELLHLLCLFNNEGICFHDQEKPMDINASFAAS